MANRLGSGNDTPGVQPKKVEPPEDRELLPRSPSAALKAGALARLAVRVAELLSEQDDGGLRAIDLCDRLGETSIAIRGALARLVQAGRVRRLGARSHTRYVLNAPGKNSAND